jgi:heat shock protein HslJ
MKKHSLLSMTSRLSIALWLSIAVVILLVACGGGGGEDPDIVGNWSFVSGSLDGAAIDGADSVTLTADPLSLGGTSACNQYGAGYTIAGTAIVIEDAVSTMMACEDPLMETERAYLDALGRVDTVEMDGVDLVLSGDGVELRFTPA